MAAIMLTGHADHGVRRLVLRDRRGARARARDHPRARARRRRGSTTLARGPHAHEQRDRDERRSSRWAATASTCGARTASLHWRSSSSSSRCASRAQGRARAKRARAAGRSHAYRERPMKPRHRRFAWIGAGVVAARRRGRAGAERVPVEPRLLLHAVAGRRRRRRRRAARSASAGWSRAGASSARPTALTVRFIVTDTAQTRPGRLHAASCPTCSGRARASSRRARSARRHVPRDRGAGEARRELHAARSGGRARARRTSARRSTMPPDLKP